MNKSIYITTYLYNKENKYII
ncbi:hypothetical protein HMPREF0999_04361, partial [Parabacteroides sp. D25]